jgi:protein dithiol oxidoreductase (disulfide-forming)
MKRSIAVWFSLLVLAVASQSCFAQWTEGKQYFLVSPAQHTNVAPGKVEVMEVFSYGCPACNAFAPIMKKLQAALPPNAQVVYLPASFIPTEDWPMFQRAYFAAQALGIAEKTHDAMFNAVWGTGELATVNEQTHQLKNPQPTIEDAARFYSRVAGVKPDVFLATAKSFGVDAKMRMADAEIGAAGALSTPTLLVNGKYRLSPQSVGNFDQLIELVKYLVAKESSPAAAAR